MLPGEITNALALVNQEADLTARSLLLAGLISELFRERGFEPVVVGGSAIEFYTDGAYMSGDTDICWAGWPVPTLDQQAEIMHQIPGIQHPGGGRAGESVTCGWICWENSTSWRKRVWSKSLPRRVTSS